LARPARDEADSDTPMSPAKKVDLELIRQLIEQGWTHRRIANELGISHKTIGYWRTKMELPPPSMAAQAVVKRGRGHSRKTKRYVAPVSVAKSLWTEPVAAA
jgi:hypothetical protein